MENYLKHFDIWKLDLGGQPLLLQVFEWVGLAVSKALKLRLWQNWLAPVKLRWDARFFLGILARFRVYIGLGWCITYRNGYGCNIKLNMWICIQMLSNIIYMWSIMNVRQTQNDMKPYKLTGDNYTVRWNDMTFNVTWIATECNHWT